ncbi:hypothetical protein BDR04DRAFT_1235629 [Suillus decipiens]|nr:hypothetical protein BDR04DRAFT_1235629 [Suillus decipiens]
MALFHLGPANYEKAAQFFLKISSPDSLGDWIGKLVAPGDFASSFRDQALQRAVLELLASLTSNAQASILDRDASPTTANGLRAVSGKMFCADAGRWFYRIAVVWGPFTPIRGSLSFPAAPPLAIIQQVARAVLRLSLASQTSTFHLSHVFMTAIGILEQLEPRIDFKSSSVNGPAISSKAPHHGHGLHIQPPTPDPLHAWGGIVEDMAGQHDA